MNKFFATNWKWIAALVVIIVIIVAIYYFGKGKGSGNATVVDDSGNPISFTSAQKAEANEIASRIHEDLNSGWLAGYNILGNIGRDDEAYLRFAQMSDTMFALTYQRYKETFGSSIIADIRDESSLPTGGIGAAQSPKDLILDKADRLNLK